MGKSGGVSRPCFFLVAGAALWVLTLYLRLLAMMSVPGALTGRAASLVAADGNRSSDPCRGRYVYIHDLPPRFNADILRGCAAASDRWAGMCEDVGNAGLGRPLSGGALTGETGWYATNQFALDAIFHARVRQYGCLTNDSSAAAAVFVPFYAGFVGAAQEIDTLTTHWNTAQVLKEIAMATNAPAATTACMLATLFSGLGST